VRSLSFSITAIFICTIGCTDEMPDQANERELRSSKPNQSAVLEREVKPANEKDVFPNETSETFTENSEEIDLNLPLPLKRVESLPRNGLVKEYFEDGSVKEEIMYLNGIKEGKRKIWYPSGQIYKVGEMKSDRWHGNYEEWYEDGTPKLAGKYLEGKQDGEWIFFDKEGNSMPALHFENGTEITRKLPTLLKD